MQQTSWNLCPTTTIYSTNCYFTSDNTFTQLSGEQHMQISDCPDGQWDLTVTRDIFDKVDGAVRSTSLVLASGYYYKVYIAAVSAFAEQNTEIALLQVTLMIALLPSSMRQ